MEEIMATEETIIENIRVQLDQRAMLLEMLREHYRLTIIEVDGYTYGAIVSNDNTQVLLGAMDAANILTRDYGLARQYTHAHIVATDINPYGFPLWEADVAYEIVSDGVGDFNASVQLMFFARMFRMDLPDGFVITRNVWRAADSNIVEWLSY
jgi:hypothetical protein